MAKILVIDDLLATGGTVKAASNLVKKSKGTVCGMIFLIELVDLKGRELLKDFNIESIIKY